MQCARDKDIYLMQAQSIFIFISDVLLACFIGWHARASLYEDFLDEKHGILSFLSRHR